MLMLNCFLICFTAEKEGAVTSLKQVQDMFSRLKSELAEFQGSVKAKDLENENLRTAKEEVCMSYFPFSLFA